MLLSARGEQYARKLPELVRESVGVSFITPVAVFVKLIDVFYTCAELALTIVN